MRLRVPVLKGQYGRAMEITELTPTPLVLPTTGQLVHVRTQEWALERWDGEDPPGLAVPWGRKPKFAVNGGRSCAELAIVHHLRAGGWDGVWVNAFGRELRTQWFEAPAARTLAEAGAPEWAVAVFDDLYAANGRTLAGFLDVFAWREPGQVGFYEAKVGPDRIKPTQLRFLEAALRLRGLEEFTIVEVARSAPHGAPSLQPNSTAGHDEQPWTSGEQTRGQEVLRRAGQDLLQALGSVAGPDDPQARQVLREVAAAIGARLRGSGS